jgi:hypothetical protein
MNTRKKLARARARAALAGRKADKAQERVEKLQDREWRRMAPAMEGCRDWLVDPPR